MISVRFITLEEPKGLKSLDGLGGIYNPIMAMEFSAMFTFQLDNTKR